MMGDSMHSTGGWYETLLAWFSAHAWWIAAVSIAYFFISLFAIRFLLLRIPPDYFVSETRPGPRKPWYPIARVGRNVLGFLLTLVGLIMSLPGIAGQGVLTVLIGISLMDIPGKRKMEVWIIRQPPVLAAINSIRKKGGQPPLIVPGPDPKPGA
jgi:hypothetical protein